MQTPTSRQGIGRILRVIALCAFYSVAAVRVADAFNPDANPPETTWTVTCTVIFILTSRRLAHTMMIHHRFKMFGSPAHAEDRFLIQARLWRQGERCVVIFGYILVGILAMGPPSPATGLTAAAVFIGAAFLKLIATLVEEHLEALARSARYRRRQQDDVSKGAFSE